METDDFLLQTIPKRIRLTYSGAARKRGLPAATIAMLDREGVSYAQLFELSDQFNLPANLTLEAGDAFDIGDYGVLGYAMMSAATLAQAVQIAVKYHRTADPLLRVNIRVDDAHVWVLLENSFHLETALYRSVVEEVIGSFPKLLLTLTGREIRPRSLELAYPDPGYAQTYVEKFGREPQFDAVETAYAIDNSSMSLPLIKADASNFALLEKSCQELLDEIRRAENFTNSVREILLREVSSINTAADVGAFLNVSERTLRRKLAQEHANFHDLLDDVRVRLAKDYLASTEMTAQEIAELLGYSESTNFRRAFLRWTSVTPQRYRRQVAQRA